MTQNRDQAVAAKVRRAKDLMDRLGQSLMDDAAITGLLEEYSRAIEATGRAMANADIGAACSACASKEHGSCCFPEIEEGYDEILLLINLLLGCQLPETKDVPDSCHFVGEKGCKLMAKYYFCIHYFCPQLQKSLGEDGIQQLLKVIGVELAAGWEIEKAVRQLAQAD